MSASLMAPDALSPRPASSRRAWLALAVLTLAVSLLAIDATVLSLAIPSLTADLAPTAAEILWIGDVYSFVLAGLLVTMGNVADRFGRRRLLLLGSIGFGVASVLAAFATSPGTLIAARALLGLAGSTIMPSTLSLIRTLFPDPRRRTTAIAVWSAGSTGGMALGPALGGLLLEHFWWGSVFLINVPVMALVLLGGLLLLPESRNTGGTPVDLLSSALSIGAIVPVVYAVKSAAHDGPTLLALGCLVVGLGLGALFVRRQRVLTEPLLDVDLFRRPSFTWAVVASFGAVFAMSGLLYFFSQYLQLVRGYTTLTAGLAELPMSVASIGVVVLIAPLVSRLGQGRALGLALAVSAVGLGALGVAERLPGYAALAVALVLIGAGSGVGWAVSTDAILGSVPVRRAGAASAISETGNELGAAMGIALLGTVQDLGYRTMLGTAADGVPHAVAEAARQSLAALAAAADPTDAAHAALLDHARAAFTDAMGLTAALAGLLLLVAAVMAWRRVPSAPDGGTGSGGADDERPADSGSPDAADSVVEEPSGRGTAAEAVA